MFVKVNQLNYHVEIFGEGEPLLLLHGFTGSTNTWSPFVNQWMKEFQVIVVDIIGHGKTDHPDDARRYRIESAASDLVELLNHLQIKKTSLLGYSMGGRLALTLTILYPDRVKALILESSSPGLQSKEERDERVLRDLALAKRIEEQGIEAFVNYWEEIPLFASNANLPLEQRAKLRQQRLDNHPQGLANSLRGMGTGQQPSWWKELKDVVIPVLLLVGEWDEKFCRINQLMAKSLAHAQLEVVKEAGHAIHMEQSGFFGKIIIDYLKDNL